MQNWEELARKKKEWCQVGKAEGNNLQCNITILLLTLLLLFR